MSSGAHCPQWSLKSVELYDHNENKMNYLSDFKRSGDAAVSNKTFVVGGNWKFTGEVFKSKSRKFTNIKKQFYPKHLWYFLIQ